MTEITDRIKRNLTGVCVNSVLFILLASVCTSCQQKSNSNHLPVILAPDGVEKLDSLQVESLLTDISATQRDSIFLGYLHHLEAKNQFENILTYYRRYLRMTPSQRQNPNIMIVAATAFQNTFQPDSALLILQELSPRAQKSKDDKLGGQIFRGLAAIAESKQQWHTAVDYYYQSMDAFKTAGMQRDLYMSQIELASVFFFLKDYPKSLSLHRQAYAYFASKADTVQMAYTLDGITVALNNLDSLDAATEAGRQSLALYKSINDKRGMSVSLNNLAHLYKRHGRLAEAEPYLRDGLSLMIEMNDARYIPVCQSNLGNCLLELNRLDEAERLLTQAHGGLSPHKQPREIANIELALAKLYEKKGEFRNALLHRVEFDRLKDTLNSKERNRILQEAANRYETKVRETEIERLQFENHKKAYQQRLIILISLALMGLITGWLIARHRRAQLILKKEKEILAAQTRAQQAELQLAKTELEAFAQNIQEKTRLLDELQVKFESHPESFSNPGAAYEFLSNLYQQRILTDDDWERFKTQFDQAYPGFMPRIRNNFPDISQAELRLALLIQLNLESREIAATLGVSPDTVKKTRQRLRKRLGLVEDEKLEEAVKRIEQLPFRP